MVKLGFSFGKFGRDYGYQDGVTMDSVPLISPLDVSQLQPPYSDQVVIKTQTEYGLPPPEQMRKYPDLEAQKVASANLEETRGMPPARMLAFAMAIMGCLLIMYRALWYDQFSCPDGFLVRHKMCTPLSLEMYYAEMGSERHRSILAAMGAYPLSRKQGTEPPLVWRKIHPVFREGLKASTPAGPATTEAPGKPAAGAEKKEKEEEKEKEKEEKKEKEEEEKEKEKEEKKEKEEEEEKEKEKEEKEKKEEEKKEEEKKEEEKKEEEKKEEEEEKEKEEKEEKEEEEEKEKEEKEEAVVPKAEGSAPTPAPTLQ